uniref:uncharacterized protein isoform X4 n=1 Tax=Pristiophorus japonicus TaxID=55135 RepID=UPI00398F6480
MVFIQSFKRSRYLCSGADVIITATYQASVAGFVKYLNLKSEEAALLLQSGVQLAKEAVEEFLSESRSSERGKPRIAGSIGPYGAFMHDGSEYSGNYVEWMDKEDEQCISHGEKFDDAVKFAIKSDQLVAIGLNCCPPDVVSPLLATANKSIGPERGWIVYPNSGERWTPNTGWGNKPINRQLAKFALEWQELGAKWIGKVVAHRREQWRTGGGPAKVFPLAQLESRMAGLMGASQRPTTRGGELSLHLRVRMWIPRPRIQKWKLPSRRML